MKQSLPNQTTNIMKHFGTGTDVDVRASGMAVASTGSATARRTLSLSKGYLLSFIFYLSCFATLFNTAQAQTVVTPGGKIEWRIGGDNFTRQEMINIIQTGTRDRSPGGTPGVMHLPIYIKFPSGFPNNVSFGDTEFGVLLRDAYGVPMSTSWRDANAPTQIVAARHMPFSGGTGGLNFSDYLIPHRGIINPLQNPTGLVIEQGAGMGGSLRAFGQTLNPGGAAGGVEVMVIEYPLVLLTPGSFELCINIAPYPLNTWCTGTLASQCGVTGLIMNFQAGLGGTGAAIQNSLNNNLQDFMMLGSDFSPETFNTFTCGVVTMMGAPELTIAVLDSCPFADAVVRVDANSPSGALTDLVVEYFDGTWKKFYDFKDGTSDFAGVELLSMIPSGGFDAGVTEEVTNARIRIPAGMMLPGFDGTRLRIFGENGLDTATREAVVVVKNVVGKPAVRLHDDIASNSEITDGRLSFSPTTGTRTYTVAPNVIYRLRNNVPTDATTFLEWSFGEWITPVQGFIQQPQVGMIRFTSNEPATYIGRIWDAAARCSVPSDTIVIVHPMSVTLTANAPLCANAEYDDVRVVINNPKNETIDLSTIRFWIKDVEEGDPEFELLYGSFWAEELPTGEKMMEIISGSLSGTSTASVINLQFRLHADFWNDRDDLVFIMGSPNVRETVAFTYGGMGIPADLAFHSGLTGSGITSTCGEQAFIRFSGNENLNVHFPGGYNVYFSPTATPNHLTTAPEAENVSSPSYQVTLSRGYWAIVGYAADGCRVRRQIGQGNCDHSVITNFHGNVACNDSIILIGRSGNGLPFNIRTWWLAHVDLDEIVYSVYSFQPVTGDVEDELIGMEAGVEEVTETNDFGEPGTFGHYRLLSSLFPVGIDATIHHSANNLTDTLIIALTNPSLRSTWNTLITALLGGEYFFLFHGNTDPSYDPSPNYGPLMAAFELWFDEEISRDLTFTVFLNAEWDYDDPNFFPFLRNNIVRGHLTPYVGSSHLTPPLSVLPKARILEEDGPLTVIDELIVTKGPDDNPWIWTAGKAADFPTSTPQIANFNNSLLGRPDELTYSLQYSSNGTTWSDINHTIGTSAFRYQNGPQNSSNFYRIEFRYANTPTCLRQQGEVVRLNISSGEIIGTLSAPLIVCSNLDPVMITNSGHARITSHTYEYNSGGSWTTFSSGGVPGNRQLPALSTLVPPITTDGQSVQVRMRGEGASGEEQTAGPITITYRINPSGNIVQPVGGVADICLLPVGGTVTFEVNSPGGTGNTGLSSVWSAITPTGIEHTSGSTFSVDAPEAFANAGSNRTVQAIVTNEFGCSQTITGSVRLFATPVITGLPTTNITRCFFEPLSFTATVNPLSANYAFSWDNSGGSDATLSLPIVAGSAAGTDITYTLSVERDLGVTGVVGPACLNTATVRVITNNESHGSCAITSTVTLVTTNGPCRNALTDVDITAYNSLGEAVTKITVGTTEVTPLPTNLGSNVYRIPSTYFTEVTNTIRVDFASSYGTVSFTVNPNPAIDNVAIADICAGAAVVFTGATTPAATFTFGSAAGGNQYGAGLASGATLSGAPNTTGSQTVHVFARTAAGCESGRETVGYIVKAVPAPSIVLAGPTPVCNLDQYTLTVTHETGATYEWKRDGSVITAGGSYSFNTERNVLTLAPNWANGSYTVEMTVDGCMGASAAQVMTTNCESTAIALGTISNNTFCQGKAVLAGAIVNLVSNRPIVSIRNTTTSYDLIAGTDYTIDNTAAPNRVITISDIYLNSLANGAHALVIANDALDQGGANVALRTVTVTVNANPVLDDITASSVCEGSQVVFAAVYATSSVTGTLTTSPTAAGTASLLAANNPHPFSGYVTSGAGCVSNTINSEFNLLPTTQPISLSVNTPVCEGETVTITTRDLDDMNIVEWRVGGNAISVANETGTTRTFTATTGGQVTLVATTKNNCPGANVTINPATLVVQTRGTASVAGGGSFCNLSGTATGPSTAPTLTASNPSGSGTNPSYAWERSIDNGSNWSSIAATTASITGDALELLNDNQSTVYRVTITSTCSPAAASAASSPVIRETVTKPDFSITNADPICGNTSLTIANDGNIFSTTSWTLNGGSAYTGTSPSFTTPATAGPHTVRATNTTTAGCTDYFERQFTVVQPPSGGTLVTDKGAALATAICRNQTTDLPTLTANPNIPAGNSIVAGSRQWQISTTDGSAGSFVEVSGADHSSNTLTRTDQLTGDVWYRLVLDYACGGNVVLGPVRIYSLAGADQPVISFSATPHCAGRDVTATITNWPGGSTTTAAWTLDGATLTGSGLNVIIPGASLTDVKPYTVRATVDNGCPSVPGENQFTTLVNALPITVSLDESTVCEGATVEITTRDLSDMNISGWTRAGANLPVTTVNATTYTFVAPATGGSISLTATAINGCAHGMTITPAALTVLIKGDAELSTSDNLTFCHDNSATGNKTAPTFTAANPNGTAPGVKTYEWQYNAGTSWENLSATGVTYQADSEGELTSNTPTQYRVRVVTTCGTTEWSAASQAVTRVEVSLPTFTALPIAVCQGGDVTITGTGAQPNKTGNTIYTWTELGTPQSGNGTVQAPGIVDWVITATNTYTVNSVGCTRTDTESVSVMLTPVLPTLAYLGETTVCHGVPLSAPITISNQGLYTPTDFQAYWEIDSTGSWSTMTGSGGVGDVGGNSISSAEGWFANNFHLLRLNNPTTSNRTIKFRLRADYDLCGVRESTNEVTITVVPFIPAPSSAGSTVVCYGTPSMNISATVVPGGILTAPRYSATDFTTNLIGATISEVGTITVTDAAAFAAAAPQEFFAWARQVASPNCTSAVETGTVGVVNLPPALAVDDVEEVCPGTGVASRAAITLSTTPETGATLTWTPGPGGTTNAMVASETNPYRIQVFAAGNLAVRQTVTHAAHNNLQCTSLETPAKSFGVLSESPVPSFTFGNNVTVCPGSPAPAISVTTDISDDGFEASYTLTWTGNSTGITANSAAALEALFNGTERPLNAVTDFALTATYNGCPGTRTVPFVQANHRVGMSAVPMNPIIHFVDGPAVCKDSPIRFRVEYQGTVTLTNDAGVTFVNGTNPTSNVTIVEMPTTASGVLEGSTYEITASAVNAQGCAAANNAVATVTINAMPAMPTPTVTSATQCQFDEVVITAVPSNHGAGQVVWTPVGAAKPGDASGTSSEIYTIDPIWSNGSYTVRITHPVGNCYVERTVSLTSNCAEDIPVVTVQDNICEANLTGDIDVTVVAERAITNFRIIRTTGAAPLTVTVPAGIPTGTTYTIPASNFRVGVNTIVAINVQGDESLESDASAKMEVFATPTAPTVSGWICEGSNVVLTISGGTSATATNFELTTNDAPRYGAYVTFPITNATSPITVTGSENLAFAADYPITARYQAANGCWSAPSVNQTFAIRQMPLELGITTIPLPDPNLEVCAGETITINLGRPLTTGETIDWTGSTLITGYTPNPTAGTATIAAPTTGFGGTGWRLLEFMAIPTLNGCTPEYVSNTAQVIVHQAGTGTIEITGASQLCEGGTMNNLRIEGAESNNINTRYVWQQHDGTEFVTIGGQTPFEYKENANDWFASSDMNKVLTTAGTKQFRVLATFGACPGTITSNTVNVVVHEQPTLSAITLGRNSGRPGDYTGENFTFTSSNATRIDWFFSDDDFDTDVRSAGTQTVPVASGARTYPMTNVTNTSGIGDFTARAYARRFLGADSAALTGCNWVSATTAPFTVADGVSFGSPTQFVVTTPVCQGSDIIATLTQSDGNFDDVTWYISRVAVPTASDWELFEAMRPTTVGVPDQITISTSAAGVVHVRARVGRGAIEDSAVEIRVVTVSATTDIGTISTDQIVCENALANTAVSLSGHTADRIEWFKDVGGVVTPLGLPNTTSTSISAANIGAITETTKVFAYVTNGACLRRITDEATISLFAPPTIVGDGITVNEEDACEGETTVTLTAHATSTDAGTLTYRWLYSTDNNTFNPVPGAGNTYTQNVVYPAGQTTDLRVYYKVEVFSGAANLECDITKRESEVIHVDWVRPIAPAGLIVTPIAAVSYCSGNVTAEYTGTQPSKFQFVRWELSGGVGELDGETDVTVTRSLAVAGSPHVFTAFVRNGVCLPQSRASAAITITPAPERSVITATKDELCSTGADNSTLLSAAAGFVGDITWQISLNDNSNFLNFADGITVAGPNGNNATASVVTSGGSTARLRQPTGATTLYSTYYVHAIFGDPNVTTGNCARVFSDEEIEIIVYNVPTVGAITMSPATTTNVCITATGIEVDIADQPTIRGEWQWQVRKPADADWNAATLLGVPASGAVTPAVFDVAALEAGTYQFRLRVTNGPCTEATSNALSVVVWDEVTAVGAITMTPTNGIICAEQTVTFAVGAGNSSSATIAEWTVTGGEYNVAAYNLTSATIRFDDPAVTYEVNLQLSNPGCTTPFPGTAVPVRTLSKLATPTLGFTSTNPICHLAGQQIPFEITNIDPDATHIVILRAGTVIRTEPLVHPVTEPLEIPYTLTGGTEESGNLAYTARAIVQGRDGDCFESELSTGASFRVNSLANAGDLVWSDGTNIARTRALGQQSGAMRLQDGTYAPSSQITIRGEQRIAGGSWTSTQPFLANWPVTAGAANNAGVQLTTSNGYTAETTVEFRAVVTVAGCPTPSESNILLINLGEAQEITIDVQPEFCISDETTLGLDGPTAILGEVGASGTWRWELWDRDIKETPDGDPVIAQADLGASGPLSFQFTQVGFYHIIYSYTSSFGGSTDTAVVRVYATSLAGELFTEGPYELCQGEDQTLTLDESTIRGDITRWEFSRTGLPSSWTSRGQADETSFEIPTTATAAADSGYYRVVVTNGVCPAAETTPVLVEIFSPTQPGTLSPGPDVEKCNDNQLLTLSDHRGDVVGWEFYTNSTSWTTPPESNIVSTSTTHLAADSGYYRAIVKHGACDPVGTPHVFVAIYSPSVAGTLAQISGNTEVCQNAADATVPVLELTGHRGTITWEQSTNDGVSWQPAVGTANGNEFRPSVANVDKFRYRATVKHGNYCTDESTTELIEIEIVSATPPGTIATIDPVCFDGNFSLVLTQENITTYTHFIWEVSTTSATEEFDPATGTNDEPTYNGTNLRGQRWYRVQAFPSADACLRFSNTVMVQSHDTIRWISGTAAGERITAGGPMVLSVVAGTAGELNTLPITSGIVYSWQINTGGGFGPLTEVPDLLEITGENELTVDPDFYTTVGNEDFEYRLTATWTDAPCSHVITRIFTITFSEDLDILEEDLDYIPTGHTVTFIPTVIGAIPDEATYTWTWSETGDDPLVAAEHDWIVSITDGVIVINTDDMILHETTLTLCVDNNDGKGEVCESFDLKVLKIPTISIENLTVCEGEDAVFTIDYGDDQDVIWTKFNIEWRVAGTPQSETGITLTLADRQFLTHNGNAIEVRVSTDEDLMVPLTPDPIIDNATLTVIQNADLGIIDEGSFIALAYSVKTFELNMTPTPLPSLPENFTWQFTTTDPASSPTVWTALTGENANILEITTGLPGRVWFRAVGDVSAEYGCPRIAGPIEVRSFDTLVWLAGGTIADVVAKGQDDATLTGVAGSTGDPEVFIELEAGDITYQWQRKCESDLTFVDIVEGENDFTGTTTSTLTVPIAWYTDEDNFNCEYRLVAIWTHATYDPVEIVKGPFKVIFSEDLEVIDAHEIGCIPVDSIVKITATYLGFADQNTWIWVDGNDVEHRLSVGNPAWVVAIDDATNPAIQTSTIHIRGNMALNGTLLKLEITDGDQTATHEPGEEFELCVIKIPSNITVNSPTVCENSTGGTAVFTINTNGETIDWTKFDIEWYVEDDLQVGETGLSFTISPTPYSLNGAEIRAEITPTIALAVELDESLDPIKAQGVLTVVRGFNMEHPRDTTVCRGQSARFTAEGTLALGSTFEWFNQAGEQIGNNTSLLVVPTPTADYEFYYRVTNEWCGSWTSDRATLTVIGVNVGDFSVNNAGLICYDGRSRTVTYTAALNDRDNYRYDWRIDNVSVPSGNGFASYTWLGITDADHGKVISLWITAYDDGTPAANCDAVQVWSEELRVINSNLLTIDTVGSPICGETYQTLLTAQNFFPGTVEWSVPAPAEWQYNADDNLFEGFGIFIPQATPYHITLTITQGGGACVGLATVNIFVPQSIPLTIEAVVDGDLIAERPIELEEPGKSVDLAAITDGRTGVTFLWEVLSLEQLPEYDLDGTPTDSTITTAVFDATFQANNWTQEIKVTATDEANGCVSDAIIQIKVKGAFALDSLHITVVRPFPFPVAPPVFDTIVKDREPGTDNFTEELLLCYNHIIYFAPRITGGTPPFKLTWTSAPGSDVYENDQFVSGTPYTINIPDSATLVNTIIGFRASIAAGGQAVYSVTIEDAAEIVVSGNLTVGIRQAPHIAVHTAPNMFNVGFYENQVINFLITPNRFVEYEFWRYIGNKSEVDEFSFITEDQNRVLKETRSNPHISENPMFSTIIPAGTLKNSGLTSAQDMFMSVVGVARDEFGCEAMDTVEIRVIPTPTVLIPECQNSPLNRVLFPNFDIEVYDTWGLRLQSFGTRGWDATFNGRKVRSGTYYYNVRIPTPTGFETFSGAVTVMRDGDYE